MNLKTFGFLTVTLATAAGALAADWGGKEVSSATHFAMKSFAKDKGDKAFDTVTGVVTKVGGDKVSAKVQISFGEKKSQDYTVKADDIAGAEKYKAPRPTEGDWGGKEVQSSAEAAMAAFVEKNGKANWLTVQSLNLAVSAQKNSARGKITYLDGDKEIGQSLFCHTHDVEIDCHIKAEK